MVEAIAIFNGTDDKLFFLQAVVQRYWQRSLHQAQGRLISKILI